MRRVVPWLAGPALVAVVAVVAAGVVGPGVGGLGEDAGTVAEPGVARVLRVVDGDTVRVRLASGAEEPVRYIGVDTPESVTPDRPVECFGARASELNRRLVAGERLRLVSDRERRDRYGRLLAYAYRERDGLFVNAELLPPWLRDAAARGAERGLRARVPPPGRRGARARRRVVVGLPVSYGAIG